MEDDVKPTKIRDDAPVHMVGGSIVAVFGGSVVVRLAFATRPGLEPLGVQFMLYPSDALALAEALTDQAGLALAPPTDGKPPH